MYRAPATISIGLLTILSFACDDPRPDQSSTNEPGWTISATPVVTIGGPDEREGYLLHQVIGTTRLGDGRIVVADIGSSEVLFYDSLGVHLRTTGGRGEGPGEFQRIMQLQHLPGDTLLVLSYRPGLTWLSPEGDYLRSEKVEWPNVASLPCRLAETNWHVLDDGSIVTLLEDNFGFDPCPPSPDPPWRQTGLLARATAFDGTFDTLGIFPATERNSPNYRAFGHTLALAFGPDRVYVGDTASEEILVLSLRGDTLRVLPTPWSAVPIPPEARKEDVRSFERPDGSVEVGNPYLYPADYPLFGRLLADDVGYLWVMAYPTLLEPVPAPMFESTAALALITEEGGARWRVLDSTGEAVAELRTAPGFFPFEIGEDYVLGVWKDAFDVQAVQLYRLDR